MSKPKSEMRATLDRSAGSGARRRTHQVTGDNTEQEVAVDVTGHATGGIELIYPDGTTGAVRVCQRPAGSSAEGQELSSTSFTSPDVDGDGDAHQIVSVPHFDLSELVYYITSAADLVAQTESH